MKCQAPKGLPAMAAALLFVVGCTQPEADRDLVANIDPSLLPSVELIQDWNERKDQGGTFAGSPSWFNFMGIVEEGLEAAGLTDVFKDYYTYERWFTSDDAGDNQWHLSLGDKSIPVASYWAYSGSTGPEGITAPLLLYDPDDPPDSMAGKIVVFEVPELSRELPTMFQDSGYEFGTDEELLRTNQWLSSNQWYQSNYVTRFGGFNHIMKDSGAAGALVIFAMGPERAAGLYTFPLLEPGTVGVPGLYLDRNAGAEVKQAALDGAEATLTLQASIEEVEPYFYAGFLPGRDYGTDADEYVLLITHADGPNLTQDNGAFGIVSVIQYFAQVPQAQRRRTLLVLIDSQHFSPDRHMTDWYALHPEITERIVATFGIEHMGQREYVEEGDAFVQSGLPETTIVFAQDNDFLIEEAAKAVQSFDLPRTMVQSPPRGGQGNWNGLSDIAVKKNYPGYGITSLMSAYWSTRARIQTFDAAHFQKQAGVAAYLTGVLMNSDRAAIALPEDKKPDA